MTIGSIERDVIAICFGPDPSDAQLAALRSENARWRLYRDMVQGRLVEVIANALPRTALAVGSEALRTAARAWFQNEPPRSPYLRDIPTDFAAWWATADRFSGQPWMRDLARFEIAIWTRGFDPSPPTDAAEFRFDRAPVFNPTLRVLLLDHPAQRADEAATPQKTRLAVWRNLGAHSVMWRQLDAFGAALCDVASIAGDEDMTALCKKAASRAEQAIDEAFVGALAGVLEVWLRDGLLLGSRGGPISEG